MPTGRPWTRKKQDYLRLHYGRNAPEPCSTIRLAETLGRTPAAVREMAHSLGLGRSMKLGGARRAYMARLYREGFSDRWIGEIAGCSCSTVWAWRKKHGLPNNCREPMRRTAGEKARIILAALDMASRGVSTRKAADSLGVHYTTLYTWLRQAALPA